MVYWRIGPFYLIFYTFLTQFTATKNIFIQDDNNNDDQMLDGSLSRPFKTLFAAISNSINDDNIIVLGSLTITEPVEIRNISLVLRLIRFVIFFFYNFYEI